MSMSLVVWCLLVGSSRAATNQMTFLNNVEDSIWHQKPPKGDKLGKEGGKKVKEESNKTFGVDIPFMREIDDLTHECGRTFVVTSSDNKSTRCPFACPFYVQNKIDTMACSFACVKAEECKKYNPDSGIADKEMGICRAPMVGHCREPVPDQDKCKVCQGGYYVEQDGQCYSTYIIPVLILTVVLLLLVGAIGWWIYDMAHRPVTNPDGLKMATMFRENSKLHQPKVPGHTRKLWPITTNLCHELVAGPGMCLHFNFQAMFILFPFCVASIWCLLGITIDNDLFVLGTRAFGTPRENCHLVSWGYETQQRLMWTKVGFTYWVYVLSFAAAMFHSIRQLRCFQAVDFENKTMKDFAVIVDNLPRQSGDSRAEEDIKRAIEDATGQRVVGVSIAWDFTDKQEDIGKAVARELRHQEDIWTPVGEHVQATAGARAEAEEFGPIRKKLVELELSIFHTPDEKSSMDAEQEVIDTLKSMNSCRQAVVVFETEAARDEAVAKANDVGIEFEGMKLGVEATICEPDTVQWENFGDASLCAQIMRFLQGFVCILIAFVLWTVVFYVPYAWSLFSFNYANGAQPGPIYSITFTMIVVAGNAIMYEVCARVSDFVGFKFRDSRETCYMILYTVACTFNVLLDFVITYFVAYKVIKGLEFRTYFGIPIEHVSSFIDRFESYSMQRMLADNAFSYLFPSTCLVPFLLEPFITIYFPMKIGAIIVRCHPEIQGQEADSYMMGPLMEMGRYADIILNVLLGNVIFFFPGGYTHTLFFGMAFAHIYIYCFDQYRVLRSVPACTFANNEVDWWSQVMIIPCVGMVLMCAIFKGNKQGYGYYYEGNSIVPVCCWAFCIHCVVHFLMLVFVVPLFGKKPVENEKLDAMTYREVNQGIAASWFSTNPIHCLRSQKIYKHAPSCTYLFMGKDHVLQVNESIGCYFCDDAGQTPRDDDDKDWKEVSEAARDMARRLTTRMSATFTGSRTTLDREDTD